MSYRDEAEAMRARMTSLEEALEAARGRAADAEAHSADREELAKRVEALETELAALRAAPPPEPAGDLPPTGFVPPKPRPAPAPRPFVQRYRRAAEWFGVIAAVIAAGLYLSDAKWCGVDLEGEPSGGSVRLRDEPSARRTAHVSGVVRAEELFSPRCRGYLPEAPLLAIEADQPTAIVLRARSEADTVMALRLEDGDFVCDDDSAGDGDPQIEVEVPTGTHRVWVGTFDEGAEADVELTLSRSR